MNAAASTYAALFQAVANSGVVKTAEFSWRKALPWGIGVPAAAAGAYGLYRALKPAAPAMGAAESPAADDLSQYAYAPEGYSGYEDPNGYEDPYGAYAQEGWY